MRVSVAFTPVEVESRDPGATAVAVIDCLRASTSIITALSQGAACVRPFLSVEEALAEKEAHPEALLAGERGGRRIEGFDLGNSPGEFTSALVAGRDIIMTTTNGTRLLLAAQGAARLFVAGFVNVRAAAAALWDAGVADVLLACAGTDGLLSIEDALCAGLIAREMSRRGAALEDSAALAVAACRGEWADMRKIALSGRGAANVRDAGLEEDLEACLVLDSLDLAAQVMRAPFRITRVISSAAGEISRTEERS